jgi:YjbE family integral membrane protein
MEFTSAAFWAALGSIIVANVLLSGDNAVVIALAARGLPPQHQRKAIVYGSGAAIVMRIALTVLAAQLLTLPFLKIIGGALLFYIGVSLALDEEDDGDPGQESQNGGVWSAIRTILVADLVMSLDNVLAVAAAAKGNTTLLILGLAISIPLIIFGSTLLLKVMERFPVIITAGAALLGWLAAEMLLTDPAAAPVVAQFPPWAAHVGPFLGAGAVVMVSRWLSRKRGVEPAST